MHDRSGDRAQRHARAGLRVRETPSELYCYRYCYRSESGLRKTRASRDLCGGVLLS